MTTTGGGVKMGARRLLALLFAQLPTNREYTTDAGKWSEALLRLRERHKEYEDLLEELTFSRRPGRRAYSGEVSKFLMRLQAGGVAQLVNPGIVRLQIRPELQREMYEHHARKVDEHMLSITNQLAAELAKDSSLWVS